MGIAILYPVFGQIILTFALMIGMGLTRKEALDNREVTVDDIALDHSRWPARPRKFANCYVNQFELPVIFYVLCLMALMTRNGDLIMVVLAWIFVATRLVHAYIHITANVVLRRGGAFFAGFIVVAIMTVLMLVRLLFPAI